MLMRMCGGALFGRTVQITPRSGPDSDGYIQSDVSTAFSVNVAVNITASSSLAYFLLACNRRILIFKFIRQVTPPAEV